MAAGIGREFFRQTEHRGLTPSDQQRGLPPPPLFLSYPDDLPRVDLPPPESADVPGLDFLDLIARRESLRRYADAPLSLGELSLLLWCTQGVKQVEGEYATLRTVPSAGARHALETLLFARRVDGLEPGLYGLDAAAFRLVQLATREGLGDALVQACFGQGFLHASAVNFFWVAVPRRMTWRYGERGYRYLLLDAGHVGQNLYLAAEAIGAGACAVAAFDDRQLDAALGLDGAERFVIYVAAVGKRPRP